MSDWFTISRNGGGTVALVDGNTKGNAIPTVQRFIDLDVRHHYVNGDVGRSPIVLLHEFTLSMDYVVKSIRETMLEWKFYRDRVTLQNDATYLDTVAQNLIQTCQGRWYEIVSVPSIPLIQDGFSVWQGDFVFRQVEYTGVGVASFATEP